MTERRVSISISISDVNLYGDSSDLVIVTGFKTHLGLRVGYAGYGYGLDFVTLTEPVPSARVSGLPVRDPSHL